MTWAVHQSHATVQGRAEVDTSQPRSRAGEEPTAKGLPAGYKCKGWDDDLNDLHLAKWLELADANDPRRQRLHFLDSYGCRMDQ